MIDNIEYNINIFPIISFGARDKQLVLANIIDVDTISLKVSNTEQELKLSFKGKPVELDSSLKLVEFNIQNSIFNPVNQSSMRFVIQSANDGYALDDPLIDLFRENDIVQITYNAPGQTELNPLGYMVIEDINIIYGLNGLFVSLVLGDLINILNRSALVQTQEQQQIGGTLITAYNQVYQLGTFMNQVINETYLSQTSSRVKYYIGETGKKKEELALGKPDSSNILNTKGSGLNSQSYVYIAAAPTDDRLTSILKVLYPYQRIVYVDNRGDIVITPLQTYFEEDSNWAFTMKSEPGRIPLRACSISKNTATINNRVLSTVNNLFIQFNQTNADASNTQEASSAQSVATPPQEWFPRAYDMVQSNLGMQTIFDIQAINNEALISNSGLLNTAVSLAKTGVTGMKSVMVVDNKNANIEANQQNALKFITSLYSARKLAESLVQDLAVDLTFPTVLSYNDNTQSFRNIPLNQMVKLPTVSNTAFDGQDELFCYGFNMSWALGSGNVMTLNLCKPYVFTALWCDKTIPVS